MIIDFSNRFFLEFLGFKVLHTQKHDMLKDTIQIEMSLRMWNLQFDKIDNIPLSKGRKINV